MNLGGLLSLWIVFSIFLYLTAVIVPGFKVTSFSRALVAAVVIGFLNMTLYSILYFLTLPITWITFGLFTFVLNAIILRTAAGLLKGFDINGWGSAIVGAVVLAALQAATKYFLLI